jgi:putative addiction module component (TIGR02574 family)
MRAVDEVAERALSLPVEDRADLVDRLLRSLEHPGEIFSEAEATAAWTQVIESRSDALHENRDSFVPWDDAKRQLLKRTDPGHEME